MSHRMIPVTIGVEEISVQSAYICVQQNFIDLPSQHPTLSRFTSRFKAACESMRILDQCCEILLECMAIDPNDHHPQWSRLSRARDQEVGFLKLHIALGQAHNEMDALGISGKEVHCAMNLDFSGLPAWQQIVIKNNLLAAHALISNFRCVEQQIGSETGDLSQVDRYEAIEQMYRESELGDRR